MTAGTAATTAILAVLLTGCASTSFRQGAELDRWLAEVGMDGAVRSAFTDLNGDGVDEALVLADNPLRCGRGGCDLQVLERADGHYRVASRSIMIWPPVRLLPTRHNGWSDLLVREHNGNRPPGEVVLRWSGGYPLTPWRGVPHDGTSSVTLIE